MRPFYPKVTHGRGFVTAKDLDFSIQLMIMLLESINGGLASCGNVNHRFRFWLNLSGRGFKVEDPARDERDLRISE
ncbi:hypothetical protein CEXT_480691 [Caerostris extrusa]|uniref:Uncharacterized protein n=1 Tax=Caerostris extrusa TaxID=172846 RepID=A0AAV4PD43_CAEEX|nr:hypothetical protein CEXT_480691 [Caerostris extrusa]